MRLTLGVTGFFLSIAFVYGIDLPWVPLEFSFSMHRIDPVEHINDVPTGDLARSYQQAVSVFIMMIGQKYYDKVLNGMDEPKEIATEITEKLINGTSDNPNDDLKIINKITLEAVDLIPLNKSMGIELFEIPKPLGPVVVDNSPRTTKQLLMDYPKLMHKDIENVRNFLDQQFIAGWNQARHFYELEVQSMRRHYSKIMLRSLATRFDDIGKNSEIIKSKVSTDVWNEFLRVNSTLQTAFEWVKSL